MKRSLRHLFGPFGMGTAAVIGICSGAIAGGANGALTESIVAGLLLAGGAMAASEILVDGRVRAGCALAAAATGAQRQLVERRGFDVQEAQMRGPSV